MIRRTAACLLILAAPLSALPVFIGTNTGNGSGSKGIYFADFDPECGGLTVPKLASPDEKHAYVINELDNTVLTAAYDGAGGFKALGTVPTLPAEFTEKNTTAEIEVSPDGRFVYASNRGHDSIAVFSRDAESGTLTFFQHAACGGKIPRHFKIAPGGKWLLCGHQGSHTISVLPLDPKTGILGAPTLTVPSPSPICILFAR